MVVQNYLDFHFS